MQEEVEHKTLALVINTTKLTFRALAKVIIKYLKYVASIESRDTQQDGLRSQDLSPGKQSVKKLVGQGQGVSSVEITDKNIKSFDSVARKYGVQYALKKDTRGVIPKYMIFYKAKDTDALTAALTEYTAKSVKREKKPSVLAKLQKFKELASKELKREKRKELER